MNADKVKDDLINEITGENNNLTDAAPWKGNQDIWMHRL